MERTRYLSQSTLLKNLFDFPHCPFRRTIEPHKASFSFFQDCVTGVLKWYFSEPLDGIIAISIRNVLSNYQ